MYFRIILNFKVEVNQHCHFIIGNKKHSEVHSRVRSRLNQDREEESMCWYIIGKNNTALDFPGGAVVKNPPANAGDTGLSPGPGRSHMLRSN